MQWLVRESGWRVTESNKPADLVAIEPRHICILFRRMTRFRTDVAREYARELEARHVPHVLVKGSSFQEREEVETMRNAASVGSADIRPTHHSSRGAAIGSMTAQSSNSALDTSGLLAIGVPDGHVRNV